MVAGDKEGQKIFWEALEKWMEGRREREGEI